MIYSMTGYANKLCQINGTTLQIDIRSVNQRFFDLTIKCPEEFKILEHALREKITSFITRGKIDLRIYYQEAEAGQAELNTKTLQQYINIVEQIQGFLPQIKLDSISDIINLPGILSYKALDIESIRTELLDEIGQLTQDLQASQQIEGIKLAAILTDKISQIDNLVANAQKLMPQIRSNYQERLRQKLFDSLGEAINNEQRFQQEFAYFCQKIDVDEELSRLSSHIKAFRDLLSTGGAIGKKIEFITQEMHREANTYGAKSVALETSKDAMELKILIEQIREQIQNLM
jgi:uncharacterized protein (TIGR00255 family)